MSTKVNGAGAIGKNGGVTAPATSKQPEQIDVKFSNKTKAFKNSLEYLETAKEQKIAALEAQINVARKMGKTNEVKALKETQQKFLNIYKNTNYTISDKGEVTFSFTKYADFNVEDFKEAYNIGNGKLRSYLRERHNNDVADGNVRITSAEIKTGNIFKKSTRTVTPDDYKDKKLNSEAEQKYYDDNDNKLYNDFISHEGSVIHYNDGMKETCEHGWFSGYNFGEPDFRGMCINERDKFTIMP